MVLDTVLESFRKPRPVSVMVHATLERVLGAERLNALFDRHAVQGYTRKLTFAQCVTLLGEVAFGKADSVGAYHQEHADALGVSRQAVYGKLNRLETAVGAGLVRETSGDLRACREALPAASAPLLETWEVRVSDGTSLAGTEHRLTPLRGHRAAALPGKAVVLYDPRYDIIEAVVPCEDAYTQERALLPELMEYVAPRTCLIGDRNFCTAAHLLAIADRQSAFVTRQHAHIPWRATGPQRLVGQDKKGREVYEEPGEVRAPKTGRTLAVRRITVALDKPNRNGESELRLLTNLPEADADAVRVSELYLERWTVETAFQHLKEDLACEVNTLAYPKAALFAFCTAVVAYNVVSVVKGAIQAAHGQAFVKEKLSSHYLAREVARVTPGMALALPEPCWAPLRAMTAPAFAVWLVDTARGMNLRRYTKHKRGPKKPPPKPISGKKRPHISTARMLQKHKRGKLKTPC